MNKPIKVVFGLNDFLVGGMQRQFAEQMRHFDTELFDITLITLFEFPSELTMYDELPESLKVYRLNFSGMFDLVEWFRLLGLLRRTSPDIVVSSLFFSNTVFRILKPLVGYVSIAREHNTYVDRSVWQKKVNRILARLSYKIVGVSKTVADFVSKEEGISREKFTVIHNGVDAERIQEELDKLPTKSELRKEMGYGDADKILLNVARLTKQKNHKLLIDGFVEFQKKYPKYKLAIVGGGSLQKELKAYADKNSVTFFGNRTDVWRFYKMADAFVSTSMIEGLSNSYLEALSSSLPLISTKTAGTDEFLENEKNGYIIENDTIGAVEEALTHAASSGIDTLKENARETTGRFQIKDTVRKYEELFVAAAS
jgi:glycosyltransferase involved in cell wall biosynthesis